MGQSHTSPCGSSSPYSKGELQLSASSDLVDLCPCDTQWLRARLSPVSVILLRQIGVPNPVGAVLDDQLVRQHLHWLYLCRLDPDAWRSGLRGLALDVPDTRFDLPLGWIGFLLPVGTLTLPDQD